MIPFPIAPLKGLTVLVTRPADQNASLCRRIVELGGAAIAFPSIVIEPVPLTPPTAVYDWYVFISANAVRFGLPHVPRNGRVRFAAIGKATATALLSHDITPDAQPETGYTSESLLAHPAFATVAAQRVLIIKGVGGRELLQESLSARGADVQCFDVYRRSAPNVAAEDIARIEQCWRDDPVDVVTLTSVATLDNLLSLLSKEGQRSLFSTPFVTVSERIAETARARGLAAERILAASGDDESIVGAIAAWHTRAR